MIRSLLINTIQSFKQEFPKVEGIEVCESIRGYYEEMFAEDMKRRMLRNIKQLSEELVVILRDTLFTAYFQYLETCKWPTNLPDAGGL
jgi:hypothetical protein